MAYSKQNFRDGRKLYSSELEKMEDSIIEAINGVKNNSAALNKLGSRVVELENADYSSVDGMLIEDNVLYLTQNGEIVSEGVPLPSGGGSSANNAVMTMSNTTGWLAKTVSQGGECAVTLEWSSLEDNTQTGNGVLTMTVGGSVKLTREVTQGALSIDLNGYLAAGSNSVKITIADVYGNTRSVHYTITVVALSISSTFNASMAYTGAVAFPYTPVGAVEKVVHFELDGVEIGTETVASSGREQTFSIPQQAHGAHDLRVWFTAEVDGTTVESNVLHYSVICVESGNASPIIACAFDQKTAKQYETLLIPYIVYNPAGLTSTVTLIADGKTVTTLNVDRTVQVWNYRLMDVGIISLKVSIGTAAWEHSVEVSATEIDVSAETSALELHLTSAGRSNNEDAPGVWENNGVSAVFTGFNFTSDGWQMDEDGITALRVTGDARLEIPVKLFEVDATGTGKTIEIEFATRNVLNYDAVILSCMSGARGIEITSQRATLTSEQSSIGTQYKEDEHVRLTFAIEKAGGNRFIYCYINGILSGVKQYPTGDDFSQASPVTISIGSNECTIDLYNIRIYGGALTRYQVLDNWIADTQDVTLLLERYERNRIYDAYDQIVIANLPKDLPYLVIKCPVLPSFKGDKKTCSGYYVDPVHPEKSFTFENAEIDVQGTSSQYYWVKNFKIKFKGGFILTDGKTIEVYQLNDGVIPTDTYTFKADVASSEGANNVVLAELYNELCPVKTPPQQADARVRQTIDGHPIVIFWDSGDGNPTFAGKYNFNHDKGTEEVFGFVPGDESWEILQNGTDRVGFHSADFTGDGWKTDFEARYPEDNTNTVKLAAFAAWVASTDPDQATGENIGAVTYGETEYTTDTAEYRLAKFRNELPQHASVAALVFYYVFTEVFLCIDQREKNAFPTLFGALKLWLILFYDADSSLGTDNKGNLAFDYYLEDIDYTEAGEPVFNGQNSVLWANLRKTYYDEITAEYKRLRTELRGDGSGNALLSYDVANGYFEDHQGKWPEAIFNEDGYKKSLEPMIVAGDGLYLPMLQGKKEQHRKWWLYNRFRYLDSKYCTGTSMTNRIMIRAHAKANVSLTAYVNMYGHVFYNAEMAEERMERGVEYEFDWAASGAEDAVIGINDGDMLTDIGDISPLMPELIDISKGTHLTKLKGGDASATYSNGNMKTLTLGNNVLLQSIDMRNCPNLTDTIDASGCANIEEIYFDGCAITGLQLPNGGAVKTLHLPGTVVNLTLLNQTKITDFVLPSFSQITTLRLENVSAAIPAAEILSAMAANSRVRLIGIDWTMDDADAVLALYDRLDTMRGLDETGSNVDKAVISGTLRIESLTGAQLAEMQSRYPYVTVEYKHITSYLYFYDDTGNTLLGMAEVQDGGDGAYSGSTPSKASTAQYTYSFTGWSLTPGGNADANALKAVTADRNLYAAYSSTLRYYTVYFYNGSTLLQTVSNVPYGGSATYSGSTPTYTGSGNAEDYEFTGFQPTGKGITGNTSCYAQFRYSGYLYTQLIDGSITEYADDELTTVGKYAFNGCSELTKVELNATTSIGEAAFQNCSALTWADFAAASNIGSMAFYNVNTLLALILRVEDAMCTLGSVALSGSGISSKGTGYVYVPSALLDSYKAASNWSSFADRIRAIEDYPEVWAKNSWEMVNLRIQQGDYATYYSIGDLIPLDMGSEGQINMQIAAFDADDLADGSGKAHISFIAQELLSPNKRMNPALVTNGDGTYQEGTGTIGGWEKSELRAYLNDTIKPMIPGNVVAMIKAVSKTQDAYDTAGSVFAQTTTEIVWVPSYDEVYGNTSTVLYFPLFENSNAKRRKRTAGSSSDGSWWLRSMYKYGMANTYCVTNSGSVSSSSPASTSRIALGFCV